MTASVTHSCHHLPSRLNMEAIVVRCLDPVCALASIGKYFCGHCLTPKQFAGRLGELLGR